ncbi:ABC transporter substrate-binding protein [Desertimonas flava]|uniref:ABC transporter substrate-binding protein n=1 Tax=Desertimonas flava TaxID=2064846 RepID=UPI0023EFADBE|nr:ABC transporter substrate-binding protein [Desertimonas flava]
MRKRTRGLSLLAAATMIGGAAVAATASATAPPDGTEAASTEAAGTEAMGTEAMGTEAMGTEAMGTDAAAGSDAPDAGAIGAGAGRGSDSGLDGYDLAGTTVTVSGVEENTTNEGQAMQEALNVFAEEHGMTITYTGVRSFESDIGQQVAGGSPPDIGVFPQPGRIAGFAASGDAFPLPDDVVAAVGEVWGDSWMALTNVDGTQFGVPFKADLKSLVWYKPARFAELGYEVPTTLDDFTALLEQAAADGNTPLCVGIGSEGATGWPFTDWIEELVLRNQGIEFYNQWVANEVPFNSPEIVADFDQVMSWWAPENVYAAGGSIAGTAFGPDNAQALVDDNCLMHRQASFFASFLAEAGGTFGTEEGQLDSFYFPANEGNPTLVGGINAAAFADRPEVWAVMQYLGSAEYASARQESQAALAAADSGEGASSGFLTAADGVDTSLFNELEQGFIEILLNADPVGFDGSDAMPAEVNTAFLTQATAFVNGEVDAQGATDAIEAAWP